LCGRWCTGKRKEASKLRSVNELEGYTLRATDGDIGKASDIYFDDQDWTVRYLVADTGGWLTGRLVLISPQSLGAADMAGEDLQVSLTRDQIESSPPITSDHPVSRQYEAEFHDYYGYPYYWGQPYLGAAASGALVSTPAQSPPPAVPEGTAPTEAVEEQERRGDPHLRSAGEVTGYHIEAANGEIGHVEDFLVDDESWRIELMVIDTRDWLPGKKVVVALRDISAIHWPDRVVRVAQTREEIESGPEFDQSSLRDHRQGPPLI